MKRNNSGMSIVEIVVIVAMLAILTGTGIYGIGQLSGFRAREGADSIASSLTEARIAMLSKAKYNGNMAWELYRKDNKYYVRTVYNVGSGEYYRDEKQIVEGTLKSVQYGTSTTSLSSLAEDAGYRVYFNRATGALCDGSGNALSNNIYFRVTHGKKDYDVYIINKTGKIVSETVQR